MLRQMNEEAQKVKERISGSKPSDDGETDEQPGEEKEMGFLDHLEELRWRLIKSFLGIAAGAIVCWTVMDWLMEYVLLKPAIDSGITLQNLRPFGQVILYMEVSLIGGIIISIPLILYQFWKFIAPGLLPTERRYISSIVAFSSLCFLAGIGFAYFVILPTAMLFFAGFGSSQIVNNIAINEYMSFVVSLMIGAGFVFELPMVSWFLSKLGILTPAFMRHYRRHAIVAIFILAAVLTPGTDPISQVLLAVPLVALYEVSIWISKIAQKKDEIP